MSDFVSSGSLTDGDARRVVVVGAGPTGLTAALELAYRGVPSIVLVGRNDTPIAAAWRRTASA